MKYSIRNKILLSFSIVVFLGFTALLITSYKINEQNTLNIIRNDMITVGNSLKLHLNQYFTGNNQKLSKDSVPNNAKALSEYLSVQIGNNVGIYDVNGNKLYNILTLTECSNKDLLEAITGKISYTVNYNGKNVLVNLSLPINTTNNTIGIVRYSRDYSKLNQYNINFYNIIKIIALIIFLFIIIVSFVISRRISKPIMALTKSTRQISEGKYDLDVRITSKDEIGELAKRFTIMAGRIKEQIGIIKSERDSLKESEVKNKAFFDNATHELKTPLATIIGYAQVIKDNGFNDKEFFGRGIDFIISESERLNNIVVNMLELSKYSSSKIKWDMEPIDLSELITQTCNEMVMRSRKYGINIISEVKNGLTMKGDRNKLKEVLINLIDNSIKYGRVNSVIHVTAYTDQNNLIIKIRDSGDGISEENIQNLFEPFYRVPGMLVKDKGSAGLGLSIVKDIVEGHGGTIQIDSKLNEGTVVTIRFGLSQG